jgi:hypothetical protein
VSHFLNCCCRLAHQLAPLVTCGRLMRLQACCRAKILRRSNVSPHSTPVPALLAPVVKTRRRLPNRLGHGLRVGRAKSVTGRPTKRVVSLWRAPVEGQGRGPITRYEPSGSPKPGPWPPWPQQSVAARAQVAFRASLSSHPRSACKLLPPGKPHGQSATLPPGMKHPPPGMPHRRLASPTAAPPPGMPHRLPPPGKPHPPPGKHAGPGVNMTLPAGPYRS